MNIHLLLPEMLLAALAFVVLTTDFFLPRRRKPLLAGVACVGLVGILAFSLAFLLDREATPLYQGILQVDRFALVFKAFFLIMGVFVILASVEFVRRYLTHPGEYYALILFSLLAMMLMAAATELLTAYISLELLSFSLYVLVSYARDDPKSNEAGVKYILLGAFSSALMLFGISQVYGALGTTQFALIGAQMASDTSLSPVLLVGLVLIIVGLGFKLAAVPFHMWAPDVYEGAPLPVTAYLAVGSKAAAFALVLRLFAEAFLPILEQWQLLIAILAALSMTVGNLVALAQHNIKRLLAYSSIGQVGYLLVGLAALSPAASNAIILHLAGYGFANLAAFVAVIAFYNATGKDEIRDFAGLAHRSPFVAAGLAVALFSLAGLPFFAGFVTKFYLFIAAAQGDLLWLAGVAIFTSLISLYYYLTVIRQMYIEPTEDPTPLPLSRVTGGTLAALMVGTVLIGVYPGPVVEAIATATQVILPG